MGKISTDKRSRVVSRNLPPAQGTADQLVEPARRLRDLVNQLSFAPPVSHVYNPLDYAWAAHEAYLRRYGGGHKRVVFLGMNPGPFGMMQVGVPFGAIPIVRDWLEITGPIRKPESEHPKRPIEGFACKRMEVSGARFWGLMEQKFQTAENFFTEHFVVNYCPLAFLEQSGRNLTPDKLRAAEKLLLFAACDDHLRQVVEILQPIWLIGVGRFAEERAREALRNSSVRFGRILHPAPANPQANKGWAALATRQLLDLGLRLE